jgi:hypothetical protein
MSGDEIASLSRECRGPRELIHKGAGWQTGTRMARARLPSNAYPVYGVGVRTMTAPFIPA